MSKVSDSFLLSIIWITRSERLKWLWMFVIAIVLTAVKHQSIQSLQFILEPFFLGEAAAIFVMAYIITSLIYRSFTKPAGRQVSSFLGLYLIVGILLVVMAEAGRSL